MRLKVSSTDRVGISQEILAVIADNKWNLKATEVSQNFTYVHIDSPQMSFDTVDKLICQVDGVIACELIQLLPTEQREKHLQALLARMPDPIIDVDAKGQILALNPAAKALFGLGEELPDSLNIRSLFALSSELTLDKALSISLALETGTFVADVHPVEGKAGQKELTGAVITLRAMNKVGRDLAMLQAKSAEGLDEIIGDSSMIKAIKAQTLRFAELDLPVLISGETGTGKELLARAIHLASNRSKAPFLAINCAAMPEHLLESELFGYESGAFTGAQKNGKPGLIELAHGGTVFLDEVAEMSPYLQAKLLRFLQDYKYRRIGGTKERIASVRIITATHQQLTSLIEQKKFREDLFYRINVLNLHLPSLRERAQDIAQLAQHFILLAAQQVNQPPPALTTEALQRLRSYHWPGNIRQLQNTLFRVVALIDQGEIGLHDLENSLQQFEQVKEPNTDTSMDVEHFVDWQQAQAHFEKTLLMSLYPLYPTTRKLAQRLGVSHNKIAMKLRMYGIS